MTGNPDGRGCVAPGRERAQLIGLGHQLLNLGFLELLPPERGLLEQELIDGEHAASIGALLERLTAPAGFTAELFGQVKAAGHRHPHLRVQGLGGQLERGQEQGAVVVVLEPRFVDAGQQPGGFFKVAFAEQELVEAADEALLIAVGVPSGDCGGCQSKSASCRW